MKDSVVIDGNNLTLIAYAVAMKEELVEERLTTILYAMIKKLKKTFYGDYYVCWDTYGGTFFRRSLDPEYKAGRDHSKVDFEIVENCKILYEALNIRSLSIPECEADDAIFSLCKVLKEEGSENITIVSADQDMIQVVQEGYADQIYNPRTKRLVEIPKYSIVEYKSIVGDKSDNIPGIHGIGPKKSLDIINGTLKLTEEQKEQFEHCRKLVDAKLNPKLLENIIYVREYLRDLI